MYAESDYLLLSGLQHIKFCPRQCALIHIEQVWTENFFTAEGRAQHEKVHSGFAESRRVVRTERAVKIASSALGLSGETDAVEFYKDGKIVPVEYKHGEPKADSCDEVQLCAQVLCLEEMLGCKIDEGALFYFKVRKRISVPITEELRAETAALAEVIARKYALMHLKIGRLLGKAYQGKRFRILIWISIFHNMCIARINQIHILEDFLMGRYHRKRWLLKK